MSEEISLSDTQLASLGPWDLNGAELTFETDNGVFGPISQGIYTGLWIGQDTSTNGNYTFRFTQPVTSLELEFDAMSSVGDGPAETLSGFQVAPADVLQASRVPQIQYTNQGGTSFDGTTIRTSVDDGQGRMRITASDGGLLTGFSFNHQQGAQNGLVFEALEVEQPSYLVLREKIGENASGFWAGVNDGDEIPGFDHVGLAHRGKVYESNVAIAGSFFDKYTEQSVSVGADSGVKALHTPGSFAWNSESDSQTKVSELAMYPINDGLAASMAAIIDSKSDSGFAVLDLSSRASIEETLAPAAQKGGNNTFTCIGLIEYAAEQAGHNSGQGFIPDFLETAPGTDFPTLSPELLSWVLEGQSFISNATNVIQGFFDPVDFMVTDPLGRKFGYTQDGGLVDEIPGMQYSGDGLVEQFLLLNAIDGDYEIELIGRGGNVVGAFGAGDEGDVVDMALELGETITLVSNVSNPSLVGDYDDSGSVEQGDLDFVLNNWGLARPFNANGDAFATLNVDQEELDRVLNNWGSSAVPDFSGSRVPEPVGLVVIAGGLTWLLRGRAWRRP